ncbi:hypothetical protein E4U43_007811 [Claviceps pusilla]|uniref:Helicase C-terminal domain-containing protein n=1 Tax=Claviceps pusilla TaxID=123648 RepID=A0A9P7T1A1_9HYPO|nr:hypothetical protein E4U43_007811 [Claviceps pusilla]
MTMQLHRNDFIPAGCLRVLLVQTEIDTKTWKSRALRRWKTIRHSRFVDQNGEELVDEEHLPPAIQEQLINSESLHIVTQLLESCWVDLEFRVLSDGSSGTLRVYLLPDDTHRELVDKSKVHLLAARRRLLDSLDYSGSAWAGRTTVSDGKLSPFVRHDSAEEEEEKKQDEGESLLHIFNSVPSPCPDENLVSDEYYRRSMADIASGSVRGLVTELYAYQRRSAAFMVQKEAEPGRVLDPRLVAIKEQDGSSVWYADSVSGKVFRMPRFFEGIAGGILAEEMGSGKTVICLALILATRALSTLPPEPYELPGIPKRPRLASLMDMAASCATRNLVSWKSHFETWRRQLGYDFEKCERAIRRNPVYYLQRVPDCRSSARHSKPKTSLRKKYLSNATLIVVPNNLVSQWKQEIAKHTTGLEVCFLVKQADEIPCVERLAELDILVFSQYRFEWFVRRGGFYGSPLCAVHFKRCIVDEGHKLGNSTMNRMTDLISGLDHLSFSCKWAVTGTPSHGLFGVDDHHGEAGDDDSVASEEAEKPPEPEQFLNSAEISAEMEKRDIERLGSITALYLKAKPWARNGSWLTPREDIRSDWGTYNLLPRHSRSGHGNWSRLQATFNSLIVRHRLPEVRDVFPPVAERVVVLEGSYQDKLSLNLFFMMIIFNTVQSQRTDVDYFFHPKQRRSLLQLVNNLKQSSFFGGCFFTLEEIKEAVETAREFLEQGEVPISDNDSKLLAQAIRFGRLAIGDKLRNVGNGFQDIPALVHGWSPEEASRACSLDGEGGVSLCTSSSLILSLLRSEDSFYRDGTASLKVLLNGGVVKVTSSERDKRKNMQPVAETRHSASPRSSAALKHSETLPTKRMPVCLGRINLLSTASAKLSYLVDSVLQHQETEKILVFYDNGNVAWYLANMLDLLQVQNLIYDKSLTIEQKAEYVNIFHNDDDVRVLLMDLSQAAFGLDMHEGTRVYFINPVLNPQVEAQAIGRVRRLSQQQPVTVETLVLKDSIDEVILERKRNMTLAEHGRVTSLLDVQPINNWIKNSRIVDMPSISAVGVASHMVELKSPVTVFAAPGCEPLHQHQHQHQNRGDGLAAGSPASASPVKTKRPSKKTSSVDDEPRSKTSSVKDENPGDGIAVGSSASALSVKTARALEKTSSVDDEPRSKTSSSSTKNEHPGGGIAVGSSASASTVKTARALEKTSSLKDKHPGDGIAAGVPASASSVKTKRTSKRTSSVKDEPRSKTSRVKEEPRSLSSGKRAHSDAASFGDEAAQPIKTESGQEDSVRRSKKNRRL